MCRMFVFVSVVSDSSRKGTSKPRKRARTNSSAGRDAPSDTSNEGKENSCMPDKISLVDKSSSLSKRQPQQDPVAAEKDTARTSPTEPVSKRTRITHPGYCITVIGCRDDVNDPEWVGNGRLIHKVTKTVFVDQTISPFGV